MGLGSGLQGSEAEGETGARVEAEGGSCQGSRSA